MAIIFPMPILIVFLVLIFSPLIQAQGTISVSENNALRLLITDIEVLTDESGQLSLDDVLLMNTSFKPTTLPFSGGYTKNTYWFKFSLQRKDTDVINWLLDASPAYLDNVQLYSPSATESSSYRMAQAGDHVTVNSRPIAQQYGINTFSITLENTSPHLFYLRLQTHSTSALNLKLVTAETLVKFNKKHDLMAGFKLGVFIVLAIHGLMMGLWLRKYTYFLVTGYILGSISLSISIGSLIPHYLFPNSPQLVNLLAPAGTCFQAIFMTLFFCAFYKTRDNFPRLNILFIAVVALSIITLMSIAFDQYVVLAPIMLQATLLAMLCFIYISWMGMRLKLLGSRTIFWSYLVFSLILYANILAATGILTPNDFLLNASQIASVVFIIFMQHGLYLQVMSSKKHQNEAESRAKIAESMARIEKERRQEQSAFMTMISHEFRTPLAVIDSAIQTMDISSVTLNLSISERHQRILESVSHLNNLLENTLSAERADNKPFHPQLETITFQPFIDTLLATTIPDNRHCQVVIPDNLICTADPQLLNLALSNLVSNALKYGSTDNEIYLYADSDFQQSSEGVLITLSNAYQSDNKPDVSIWFEKYYRAPHKSAISGFGLGLYLIKKIATAHGGSVSSNVIPKAKYWQVSISIWLPTIKKLTN